MRKALFGISLDNPLYSSATMRAGLSAGLRSYDEIVFLIADSLQIYNYVAKNISDKTSAAATDWSAPHSQYFVERSKWLAKIRARLPKWDPNQKWTVVSVNTIADRKAFQIQRSVRILYAVDESFRNDVVAFAQKFADRDTDTRNFDQRINLSVLYILEEIALNIRLRIKLNIEDEYYLGHTFSLFRNIYGKKYLKDHNDLFGGKLNSCIDFKFHSWNPQREQWIIENGIVNYEHDMNKLVDFRNM
jgi:tRNA-dependent cyclodipeptide synthase